MDPIEQKRKTWRDHYHKRKEQEGFMENRRERQKGRYQKEKERQKQQSRDYYQKNREKILERQKASKANKISQYKGNARRRNHEWCLSDDDAISLFLDECHYCGKSPSPLNGIDRIDSKNGYKTLNVRTACDTCNYMKGEMTTEEFLEKCFAITQRARGWE